MKRIFASANEFVRESDWKDLAVLKICLLSLGLLAGMRVTEQCRRGVKIAAAAAFVLTYIPLMAKYLGILLGKGHELVETRPAQHCAGNQEVYRSG